jgi:hypothetical protein
MPVFLFGKKRRAVKKSRSKKPPAALLKKCKKYHIKTTVKRGRKRMYKKVSVLKKLLAKKMKKMRKARKMHTHRKSKRRHVRRTVRFSGFGDAAPFGNPKDFGYNQPVVQNQGILNQSSSIVTDANNINRPAGLGLPGEFIPTYGVYRPFFGEQVPAVIGPNSIGFMGQPDGSMFAVGSPFVSYKTPASFGRRRKNKNKGRY